MDRLTSAYKLQISITYNYKSDGINKNITLNNNRVNKSTNIDTPTTTPSVYTLSKQLAVTIQRVINIELQIPKLARVNCKGFIYNK